MHQEKRVLRRRCHEIRVGFPLEKVQQSSRAVCHHLSSWSTFRKAKVVLSFLTFRNEIDPSQLFHRWPDKHWLVPRVVEGTELAAGEKPFLALHSHDPQRLARHRFGMLEPESGLPRIDPDQTELILAPGVAFDRRGGRLGYGGGFYDRLFPLASRALRVGVTYEELVFDAIPMASWDHRVEWLVTPRGLFKAA
jgi:5-formyltetrahydrofolate cyclo-ligase